MAAPTPMMTTQSRTPLDVFRNEVGDYVGLTEDMVVKKDDALWPQAAGSTRIAPFSQGAIFGSLFALSSLEPPRNLQQLRSLFSVDATPGGSQSSWPGTSTCSVWRSSRSERLFANNATKQSLTYVDRIFTLRNVAACYQVADDASLTLNYQFTCADSPGGSWYLNRNIFNSTLLHFYSLHVQGCLFVVGNTIVLQKGVCPLSSAPYQWIMLGNQTFYSAINRNVTLVRDQIVNTTLYAVGASNPFSGVRSCFDTQLAPTPCSVTIQSDRFLPSYNQSAALLVPQGVRLPAAVLTNHSNYDALTFAYLGRPLFRMALYTNGTLLASQPSDLLGIDAFQNRTLGVLPSIVAFLRANVGNATINYNATFLQVPANYTLQLFNESTDLAPIDARTTNAASLASYQNISSTALLSAIAWRPLNQSISNTTQKDDFCIRASTAVVSDTRCVAGNGTLNGTLSSLRDALRQLQVEQPLLVLAAGQSINITLQQNGGANTTLTLIAASNDTQRIDARRYVAALNATLGAAIQSLALTPLASATLQGIYANVTVRGVNATITGLPRIALQQMPLTILANSSRLLPLDVLVANQTISLNATSADMQIQAPSYVAVDVLASDAWKVYLGLSNAMLTSGNATTTISSTPFLLSAAPRVASLSNAAGNNSFPTQCLTGKVLQNDVQGVVQTSLRGNFSAFTTQSNQLVISSIHPIQVNFSTRALPCPPKALLGVNDRGVALLQCGNGTLYSAHHTTPFPICPGFLLRNGLGASTALLTPLGTFLFAFVDGIRRPTIYVAPRLNDAYYTASALNGLVQNTLNVNVTFAPSDPPGKISSQINFTPSSTLQIVSPKAPLSLSIACDYQFIFAQTIVCGRTRTIYPFTMAPPSADTLPSFLQSLEMGINQAVQQSLGNCPAISLNADNGTIRLAAINATATQSVSLFLGDAPQNPILAAALGIGYNWTGVVTGLDPVQSVSLGVLNPSPYWLIPASNFFFSDTAVRDLLAYDLPLSQSSVFVIPDPPCPDYYSVPSTSNQTIAHIYNLNDTRLNQSGIPTLTTIPDATILGYANDPTVVDFNLDSRVALLRNGSLLDTNSKQLVDNLNATSLRDGVVSLGNGTLLSYPALRRIQTLVPIASNCSGRTFTMISRGRRPRDFLASDAASTASNYGLVYGNSSGLFAYTNIRQCFPNTPDRLQSLHCSDLQCTLVSGAGCVYAMDDTLVTPTLVVGVNSNVTNCQNSAMQNSCPVKAISSQRESYILPKNAAVIYMLQGRSVVQFSLAYTPKDIAAGNDFFLLLDDMGSLRSFGRNLNGTLGMGSYMDFTLSLLSATTIASNIASIFAGPLSAFAIDTQGGVFAWGANDQSQLGIEGGALQYAYGIPAENITARFFQMTFAYVDGFQRNETYSVQAPADNTIWSPTQLIAMTNLTTQSNVLWSTTSASTITSVQYNFTVDGNNATLLSVPPSPMQFSAHCIRPTPPGAIFDLSQGIPLQASRMSENTTISFSVDAFYDMNNQTVTQMTIETFLFNYNRALKGALAQSVLCPPFAEMRRRNTTAITAQLGLDFLDNRRVSIGRGILQGDNFTRQFFGDGELFRHMETCAKKNSTLLTQTVRPTTQILLGSDLLSNVTITTTPAMNALLGVPANGITIPTMSLTLGSFVALTQFQVATASAPSNVPSPTRLTYFDTLPSGESIVKISAERNYTVFLSSVGRTFVAGSGSTTAVPIAVTFPLCRSFSAYIQDWDLSHSNGCEKAIRDKCALKQTLASNNLAYDLSLDLLYADNVNSGVTQSDMECIFSGCGDRSYLGSGLSNTVCPTWAATQASICQSVASPQTIALSDQLIAMIINGQIFLAGAIQAALATNVWASRVFRAANPALEMCSLKYAQRLSY